MPFVPLLDAIALLLAALFAPAWAIARVARGDARRLRRFKYLLECLKARGLKLRYPGEDDATVALRLAHLEWIVADPRRALRHTVRRMRGHWRWRLGRVAPPSFAPPALAIAALADACVACTLDDTS